ncbi:MAG: DNA recombination protein RmuC [Verrucomicrobia bacterium]|nr:DNA recombination protein RmuC [Verrucomicrobiota bacterium]
MEILMALVAGVLAGGGLVYFVMRGASSEAGGELSEARDALARAETRLEVEGKAAEEKMALLEATREKLMESFEALSAKALSSNNDSFLKLAKASLEKYQASAKGDLDKRQEAIQKTVEPVGKALEKFEERVNHLEERRTQTDAGLKEQLEQLAQSQHRLSQTTTGLMNALRKPEGRGRWGELQLRRTVELAGMINYCDFEEQTSVETDTGDRLRPDMLIRLPNERQVVVDSKVPLAAYLEALEEGDAAAKTTQLERHARHIREHIKGLSQKKYWSQFENTAEFVVLFVPNEAIFSAALEVDPQLIELGVENRVILATPTTLIALLKAIAYGWQQDAVAREAREISALGKELYERIGVVVGHFASVGKSLGQTVNHYNKAISSAESRLLVTARKFEALDSVNVEALPESKTIETIPTLPREDGTEG